MRFTIALLVTLGLMASAAGSVPVMVDEGTYVVAAAQQPSGEIEVDIGTGGDAAWWTNPVWIGIGIVALIALIAIIVAALRGGTTVIKE